MLRKRFVALASALHLGHQLPIGFQFIRLREESETPQPHDLLVQPADLLLVLSTLVLQGFYLGEVSSV